MRERPLIFDSEHLSLRGDRNHIIVEFKGEPALIDPIGKISHPAVNWLTKEMKENLGWIKKDLEEEKLRTALKFADTISKKN